MNPLQRFVEAVLIEGARPENGYNHPQEIQPKPLMNFLSEMLLPNTELQLNSRITTLRDVLLAKIDFYRYNKIDCCAIAIARSIRHLN